MKKKDAYYFSHDANSQDDPKCMILIDEMGMEGYGIFWALIEKLRAEKTYILPLEVIKPFAKRWNTEPEKIEKVINDFGLFEKKANYFFSKRLKRSMEKKSEAARNSVSARYNATNVYDRSTTVVRSNTIKVKENKIKKNTPNGSFSPDGEVKKMVY